MLRAIRLAWISSVRQPARTGLGILGVAAVGALLFDMLLLSRGLVVSFRDLLDRAGFDVRILATDSAPLAGPTIVDPDRLAVALGVLPEVEAVVPVSFLDVELVVPDSRATSESVVSGGREAVRQAQFIGADPRAATLWTLLEGQDLADAGDTARPVIINRTLAEADHLAPGSTIALRGACGGDVAVLPPVRFTVAGIGEFPFAADRAETLAGRQSELDVLCADRKPGADMVLVRSRAHDGGEDAAAAIRTVRPDLYVMTNGELVEQFSRVQFSYFRQISFVLATVTLFFGFLLIAVLLTASVNQRLAEIAALRALGLSRGRVVAGVLAESAIMVGLGAVLAVPAGFALSIWLDEILRRLPGIPTDVHFFVFEPRVLAWYSALLVASAVGAALYPIRIVARLPIAATLRREVVG